MFVMAEKKMFVNALLHLEIHHSLQTVAMVVCIVGKGKEQSLKTDSAIIQTATMNSISASTEMISLKMSYEQSQSMIQKNKSQTERTTFNCFHTTTSQTTPSLVTVKV